MKAPTEKMWQNSVISGFMLRFDILKQKQMQLHTETVLTVRCDICACLPSL